MGSVAGEHPEPITPIFTGPEMIWSKKAFNATVLLHYIVYMYRVCSVRGSSTNYNVVWI